MPFIPRSLAHDRRGEGLSRSEWAGSTTRLRIFLGLFPVRATLLMFGAFAGAVLTEVAFSQEMRAAQKEPG
jgi:hypothetical protein